MAPERAARIGLNIQMQICRFGKHDRQLVGLFHDSTRPRTPQVSVLLCGPLGQESVRAHRAMRLISEALARTGIPTLRFDYFGTGDSTGDDTQCTLRGCSDDILAAHAELARRTLSNRVIWVGVRLGANAALSALPNAPWSPKGLVLWEPILDGSSHFSRLQRQHDSYVKANVVIHTAPSDGTTDLLGFAVGSKLRGEIEALKLETVAANRPASVALIAPSHDHDCERLAQLWRQTPGPLNRITLDHGLDWNAEEAMNTALAPPAAVASVTGAVEELLA